jgi:FAD-dependent urate hydroxylase
MVRVIIVGGGLGGLLLANKLVIEQQQQNNNAKIEVIVLERDESPHARGQGIVIGLSQHGLDALNSVKGLETIPKKVFNPNGAKNLALRSSTGRTLVEVKNVMTAKLHDGSTCSVLVPRAELRKELALMLPEGIIRWNSRVVDVKEEGSRVTAILHNGETIEGDILIAADGARSAVRQKCFPNLLPNALGLFNFHLTIPESKFAQFGSKSKLLNDAKKALTRTTGRNGCSILAFVYYPASTQEEAVMFWAASMPTQLAAPVREPNLSEEELLKRARDIIQANMDEPDIVKAIDIAGKIVPGYELTSVYPDLYQGRSITTNESSRVTVLGDAAHKTTTQAGLGATAAFQDAVDLGQTILDKGDSLGPEHLRQYEARMCDRAKAVVGASYGNTQRIHQVRGPVGTFFVNSIMWTVGCIISAVQFVKG